MAVTTDQRSNILLDILTIQPSSLSFAFCSTIILLLAARLFRSVRKGYHEFLSLGQGGVPSTFPNYLRVSYFRLFAITDVFQPPSLAESHNPSTAYLHTLPQRSSPRPRVAGIVPHRQVTQRCPAPLHDKLRTALLGLVDGHPSLLTRGMSCFEKHGLAFFLSSSEPSPHPSFNHLNPTCENTGEIAHLHDIDGSMHATLHPVDAALVIAAGWGQMHPIAGRDIHGKRYLPAGFTMIYAPATEEEIEIVVRIVRASAWWVGGVVLGEGKEEGTAGGKARQLVDARDAANEKKGEKGEKGEVGFKGLAVE
ncbi:MAG: hypothetical protein OHK93_001748 [Ramalina farinacea]|uniref:Luciferase domain-containing protein n=1 Tax=Ramalina farinacea TaxID=258253 RepID=A0AA43TWK2_9LECA|nr:hypothetical protein [Ramalina farinacea]